MQSDTLVTPANGKRDAEWVLSVDTLIEGTHFLASAGLDAIAHKALAVNLSDMAAMGATPFHVNAVVVCAAPGRARRIRSLLVQKCRYLAGLAAQSCRIVLVDGPGLNLSLEIIGSLAQCGALRRSGAREGDQVFVSGTLGDASAGLRLQRAMLSGLPSSEDLNEDPNQDLNEASVTQAVPKHEQRLLERLHRPTARLVLGQSLVGHASACIDISDGLLSDLGHICKASKVSAEILSHRLPLSEALLGTFARPAAIDMALSGGDDYELCFTAPSALSAAIKDAADAAGCHVSCIGSIRSGDGQVLVDGSVVDRGRRGFDHFSTIAEAKQH